MDAINSAVSALQAARDSQAVTANNIANVNSSGFKSRLSRLAEMSGGGVKASAVSDNRDGYLIPTDNPKDVAIFGETSGAKDYETYYGNSPSSFRMDAFGNLFAPSGNLLFTSAGAGIRLDDDGNLFRNDELIGTLMPVGAESQIPTGETILSGFLMGSNVNISSEMVNNMVNLRYFQLNAKTIETADEMFGTVLDMKG